MKASRSDTLDILLLIGSILALGFSVVAAGGMAIIAGVNNILQLLENAQAAWSIALIFTFMGLLTLPGLYLSYRSINGHPARVSQSIPTSAFIVGVGLPFGIALGTLGQQLNVLAFILEPLGHVLAAISPMLFLSVLVIRQLPLIPWRRVWGQFTGGLWLSPMIALILELAIAIPLVVLLFAYVLTEVDPREFIQPLTSGAPLNQASMEAQLQTLLRQPVLIISGLLFVSLIVPILEEMVKTFALWPMLRRGISPLYAFAGGAIAGGAYGLFEAFFLAQPGEGWAGLMVARAGATSMHMITTAMVSLGIALAIQTRKWVKALRYYLYAVLLHGTWNLAAIGVAAVYLVEEGSSSLEIGSSVTAVSIGSGIILSLLAAGAVFGLYRFPKNLLNQKLQSVEEASTGVS
ncbi:MAG: PrsW family glutamic-type intramembrane protease [Anaerolineales bacterium]|jgi:hypothetical protein